MKIKDCKILDLPKIEDLRGNLTFIEEENHIPFRIKRVYWIFDVPGGQVRGGHAFRQQKEFIIALSGSFDVVVQNATEKRLFALNRSYYGLYVQNGLWRHMENFSTNAVALVLSSTLYADSDYIRNYEAYLEWLKKKLK